jgi:hypothetical protein
VPPVAAADDEYAWFTEAFGDGHATAMEAPMEIDRLRVIDAEAASATRTVNVADPAADGVPLICPDWFKARPAGSVPDEIDQV